MNGRLGENETDATLTIAFSWSVLNTDKLKAGFTKPFGVHLFI